MPAMGQFTVEKWFDDETGGLKVGMTGVPPTKACRVETATELSSFTVVLATAHGREPTRLYINGKMAEIVCSVCFQNDL